MPESLITWLRLARGSLEATTGTLVITIPFKLPVPPSDTTGPTRIRRHYNPRKDTLAYTAAAYVRLLEKSTSCFPKNRDQTLLLLDVETLLVVLHFLSSRPII